MKEITLKATIENVRQITEWIDSELEKLDCSMKAQMQIDVAIDELVSNIARYAYGKETGEVTVQFRFDEAERAAEITFVDRGVAFDPLEKSEPDVTLSAEDRPVGGLGIFLVRKTMDRMDYRRENGRNILTVKKKI